MRIFAGLDMGKTKVSAGLVDVDSGRILESVAEQTDWSGDGINAMPQALRLCTRLLKGSREVLGLGIGTYALIDHSAGIIRKSVVDSWQGFPIVEEFRRCLGLPVAVNTDVEVAALGEARFGGGVGCNLFAYITVSTGVGLTTVHKGVPWHGVHSLAGHIAHIRLPSGLIVDEVLGGKGIEMRAASVTGRLWSCKEVFEAARKGIDGRVLAIVDDASNALALILAFVQEFIDPQTIVIGGSVAVGQPIWLKGVVEVLTSITKMYQGQLPSGPVVKLSTLNGNNAMLGAACLVNETVTI